MRKVQLFDGLSHIVPNLGLLAGAGIAATLQGNIGTAVALLGAALLAITFGMAGVHVGGHWRVGMEDRRESNGS